MVVQKIIQNQYLITYATSKKHLAYSEVEKYFIITKQIKQIPKPNDWVETAFFIKSAQCGR